VINSVISNRWINVNNSIKSEIIVAGDITIDWFQWVTKYDKKNFEFETLPNWAFYPGTRMKAEKGGALLLAEMVKRATNANVYTHALNNIKNIPPQSVIHSTTILDAFPLSKNKEENKDGEESKEEENKVFRVKQYCGFCGPNKNKSRLPLQVSTDNANVSMVILDDAGNGFRNEVDDWLKTVITKDKETIIILKMSYPLASGKLWDYLQEKHLEKLITIIRAEDLRKLGVNISRHLSWEQTAEDFYWQMKSNPLIKSIAASKNLIVRFGLEGAIHYTNCEGKTNATLYYDPNLGEDGYKEQYEGDMQGVTAAFVAAFAAEVLKKDLNGIKKGIFKGINKSRKLFRIGFLNEKAGPAYPISELFDSTKERNTIFKITIPDFREKSYGKKNNWRILEERTRGKLESIASDAVTKENKNKLKKVPIARFDKLLTLDREEIESFQSIKNIMSEYLNRTDVSAPLSIAVFGPPGSGKSVGVTGLATSLDKKRVSKIQFNVSQFTSITDLISAFHQVRDTVLEGKIPLVFFDEFDSSFNGELGWLKYFLAPMQDGSFKEGETTHPIGKSIFVFAGGTSHTFQQFSRESLNDSFKMDNTTKNDCETQLIGKSIFILTKNTMQNFQQFSKENPNKDSNEKERMLEVFRKAKGPDFVSRLRGYVNIMGPNSANADDTFFIIRRALLLRSLLRKMPQIFDDDTNIRIDPGVVRAFLKVPVYKHGARSMEAIIDMSMLGGRKQFDQAALPPSKQLELHVNSDIFVKLVLRDVLFKDAMERLAKEIHEQYCIDQKKNKNPDDPAMQPWENLREDLKKSNRKQAEEIPEKLRRIGLDFMPYIQKPEKPLMFSEEQVELLAEMEHERWIAERKEEGWKRGSPRDPEKKISPYLIPWSDPDLTEEVKDWDRNAVKQIPELLEKAGFEVYPLQ
jgi:hypothetical protein